MRTPTLRLAGILALLALSCTATPSVTVLRSSPGGYDTVQGDTVKFRRGVQDPYGSTRGGFYVIRGAEDWQSAWQAGAEQNLPGALDTTKQMVLLAAAEKSDVVELQVKKVLETAGFVHVWVRETKRGENCVNKPDLNPFDAVVTPRIDKPVRFYVEEQPGESCGDPAAVDVKCRVGTVDTWAQTVTAEPGDVVDCRMTAEVKGRFAVADRVLTLGDLPGGSATKLAYENGPTRGKFTIDVFGTYNVFGEAVDEGGRKTTGKAQIDVLPPKTRDVLVQLVWTNFDVSDDPETFPRVKLRAVETGKGAVRDCSTDSPKSPGCEVRTRSAYTHLKLAPSTKKTSLSVSYLDERVEKGPLVCLQVYFEGVRTADTCDRKHRDADSRWDAGTLDMTTGRILELSAPVTDGGVPEAGTDASAPDAATKNAGKR